MIQVVTAVTVEELLPFLYEGKGQRVCDVVALFGSVADEDSEKEILVALEEGVDQKLFDRYEQNGVVFYMKKVDEKVMKKHSSSDSLVDVKSAQGKPIHIWV